METLIYIVIGVIAFLIGISWQKYKAKQAEILRIEQEKLNTERARVELLRKQEAEKEAEKQKQIKEAEQKELQKVKNWWYGLNDAWKKQIRHNQSHNFHRQFDINNLSDIDLRKIEKMDNIYLDSLFVSNIEGDLTPLTLFKDIYRLKAEGNQISDLQALRNLTKLQRLYLDENYINDLTPIENLENLEMLLLHNNSVSNLSPISKLKKLECLILYGNKVTDLSPLANLTNLVGLGISNNPITSLQPIWNLNLGALDCSGTFVSNDELNTYFKEHPNCRNGIGDPRYVSKSNPTGR